MPTPFENDTTAREVLEALRWPDGPRCPRCDAGGPEVFKIGGEKHSHRDGLYQCKPCRRQFSVTVGTPLERLRIPLTTWMRAARAFSYQGSKRDKDIRPQLLEMQAEIGVSYRTVLRMRDIIKRAASKYRGHKSGFGAWPRSFMHHEREQADKTILASEVLAGFVPWRRVYTQRELSRTERLLKLLLAVPKRTPRKRRSSALSEG